MSDTERPLDAPGDATQSGAEISASEQPDAAGPPPSPVPEPVPEPEMPVSPSLRDISPAERLRTDPTQFDFDQAVAVAARIATGPDGDPLDLSFRTVPRLAHPAGAVVQARPEKGELTVASFGLLGAGGTLPRHHTAMTAAELRKRSAALHAFLDLLSRRFVALHAKAGAKYRPARNPEPASRVLAAAIGMGTGGLDGRLSLPLPALLYHAGNLATRNRSAERLRAMLEAETGRPVELVEFAGGWVRLPDSEQSRLPRARGAPQHCALGQGAAVGAQVWDPQARFVIRIGPLTREEFDALLPGTPAHRKITQLARLFVGLDTGFAVNLVLKREEVPAARLGGGSRLGWSTWVDSSRPRAKDAVDPLFEAKGIA